MTQLSGCVTTFTFMYTGTKRVTLTVRDATGRTGSATREVVVGSPLPAGPRYAETVLGTPGLTHYWRLGESAGSAAAPAKGSVSGAHSAVAVGQPGLLAGDADRAAAFNGVNSSTRVGDIGDFAGTARFSVEAWVKPSAVDSVSRRILSKEAAGTNGWLLWSNSSRLWFGRLRKGTYQSVSTAPLKAGVRTHVVVTYDGGTLRLYVDGARAASAASSQALPDTTAPLTVGAGSLGYGSFAGTIDEPALYAGTALTDAQVQEHFKVGSGA